MHDNFQGTMLRDVIFLRDMLYCTVLFLFKSEYLFVFTVDLFRNILIAEMLIINTQKSVSLFPHGIFWRKNRQQTDLGKRICRSTITELITWEL
jgi:hypothetical protein